MDDYRSVPVNHRVRWEDLVVGDVCFKDLGGNLFADLVTSCMKQNAIKDGTLMIIVEKNSHNLLVLTQCGHLGWAELYQIRMLP
jgi:hypothetical protein